MRQKRPHGHLRRTVAPLDGTILLSHAEATVDVVKLNRRSRHATYLMMRRLTRGDTARRTKRLSVRRVSDTKDWVKV